MFTYHSSVHFVDKDDDEKYSSTNFFSVTKGQSILHFLHVRKGQRTVRVALIASSEQYVRTVHASPDFCNRAYFVRSGRTCALKLFCCNHVFPHGGNTVLGCCFTVENETKETDNANKIAETATTDAHIDERL